MWTLKTSYLIFWRQNGGRIAQHKTAGALAAPAVSYELFAFPDILNIDTMPVIMWQKLYKTFRSSFGIISIIIVIVLWSAISYFGISYGIEFFSNIGVSHYIVGSDTGTPPETKDCNVLAIALNGELDSYLVNQTADSSGQNTGFVDAVSSQNIVSGIESAKNDPNIKAVILSIDSSGGYGTAGEEIANAMKSLSKPNAAVIRTVGASAAYWAATGAQKIYASKISDVGSIGVTQSYLDQTAKDAKDGYKFIELSSVQYKNMGDPSRPLSDEEKAIILADLKKNQEVFVQEVATNRNLKVTDVNKIANGLTYVGIDALKYGLIDEIGDMTTVTKYLEDKIGEKANVCWY